MNKAILIGNVGKDPETRQINETTLSTFSLATSEKWKNGERTDWHTVKVWGKLSEVVEKYVKKGMKVCIEGRIQYDKLEKDGETKYFTSINADRMEMLSKKQAEEKQEQLPEPIGDDNDLPF